MRANALCRVLLTCGVAGLLLAAGCARKAPRAEKEAAVLPPASKVPLTKQAMERQAAAGARMDAGFVSVHFDAAGRVNSLGREKLRLIFMDAGPDEPVLLYVQAEKPELAEVEPLESLEEAARQLSADGQKVVVREGYNPQVAFPAASALERQKLIDEAAWKMATEAEQTE